MAQHHIEESLQVNDASRNIESPTWCEEGEHLRLVYHGLWNVHHQMEKDWIVDAQDAMQFDMYTDGKSLEQYVNQAGLHSVADKGRGR